MNKIVSRPFEGEDDFWRVRDLLIATYPIAPIGFNWEIRRWDGWRFHRELTAITPEWGRRIHLWETVDGQLIGVAHPESDGSAFFQVHPDFRDVEVEMMTWAEANLVGVKEGQTARKLQIDVMDYDRLRQRLLAQRGYEQTRYTFNIRRLRFGNRSLPSSEIAPGYRLCCTQESDTDYERMAAMLNAGFNRSIHTPAEYRSFATGSPSFEHELNLVAEATDGSFAAHVGLTYEATNRYGIVEPVCTHPDHRRRGLARSLIVEGLHRLRARGATDVYLGTGDSEAANAFYDDVGFSESYNGHVWQITL